MNFANYDINIDAYPIMKDMTKERLNELKDILRNFIDDTDYIDNKKLTFEVHGETDSTDYQSICRIYHFILEHYKKLLFDDFARVFTPWDIRSWSAAENYVTLDKKFFVRTMHGFWYCLPIVKYSPDIITVKTPDELAMEGDYVKSYNNLYTCMLGFIINLIEEYFLN